VNPRLALRDPHIVRVLIGRAPVDGVIRIDEVLDLHLLELARAKDEVSRRDLVAERLPICAIPKGSLRRVACRTLSKLTKMPCAVSGRRYVSDASSSTAPMNVLNMRLNCRGAVNCPLPHAGHRLRCAPQCLHASPAATTNLLPLVASQ
jgi:hypothetical protein